MKNIQNKTNQMIIELVKLANNSTSYERYSCNYIEELSDVNYSILKRAYVKANPNKEQTLSRYVNSLLRGKLKESKAIVV